MRDLLSVAFVGVPARARGNWLAPTFALAAVLTLLGFAPPAEAVDYKMTVYRINKDGNVWRFEAQPLVNNRAVSLTFNNSVSSRNESISGGFTLNLRTRKNGTTIIFVEHTLFNPNNPFNDSVIGVSRGLSSLSSPGGNTKFSNFHFYSNVSSTRKLWVSFIEATLLEAEAQAILDAEINRLKETPGKEEPEVTKEQKEEPSR